ncbi:WD40/YVTN/BNR-like repeat-containing protein [Hymenobacter roseosalivarius]|nr:hypothetical protein [Hymenobacter roseosalivarius]
MFAINSCNRKQNDNHDLIFKKYDFKERSVKNKYVLNDEYDPSVYDLLPVSGDTLVVAKWKGGLSVTTDAGLHWNTMHTKAKQYGYVYFKHIMIDDNGVLWGLDSWQGIHEPDYSRISYSFDLGKTWSMPRKFDTNKFFPLKFYSQPNHPLQVVATDGKVYEAKDDLATNWRFIKYIPELNYTVNNTIHDGSYFDDNNFKLIEVNNTRGELYENNNDSWKLVFNSNFITEASGICHCDEYIYLVGTNRYYGDSAYYLFKIQEGEVIEKIKTPQYSAFREAMDIKCDDKKRLWLYSFRGIWLKQGKKLYKKY